MNENLDLRPPPERTIPAATPVAPRKRGRGVGFLIVLVLLLVGGLIGWRLLERRAAAPAARQGAGGPPQSVGVATIGTGDIDITMTGLGAVTPIATVTIKTQINGLLQQIGFQEGQLIHKGDFLFQIDPRPYQVALALAQGALAKDTALLAQARADYARYQTLGRQDSISRQQVEDQAFLIKQDEGQVITDNANIDSAKLNLVYCHITSPVDGRVGIRLVDLGNYVQASDTNGLVVVTQLQPISVLFTLPEDDIDQVARQMGHGALAVTAYDRTNTTKIATGTLGAMDTQIDSTTGTVKLRALFPNTDNSLFPQQFVNAQLLVQTLRGVVVAPQAAVQSGAPGSFVYLVKPDNTVAIQVVKTGAVENNRVQILDGLKAGDKVVTDGVDRLRDGARISIAPPPGEAPAAAPRRRPTSGSGASSGG